MKYMLKKAFFLPLLMTLIISIGCTETAKGDSVILPPNNSTSDDTTATTVEVYAGFEEKRSKKYKVNIIQGKTVYESFVYEDANKHIESSAIKTDMNHWTNFSFEGGEVKVEVIALGVSNITDCEVRPLQRGINATLLGNKITFTIDKPVQLFVKLGQESKHPLFIFANPIDEKPSKDDPNVVYWGEGVHNIGKHYRLEANKTYYLEGGAYVKGTMLSDNNASNITVRGRGVFSSEDIPHAGYNEVGFDRLAIRFQGSQSENLYVEGITIINPPQYCLQAYGAQMDTDNIKCFGWWFETDGWVAGNSSTLKNSFFKVYDDIVKLYFENLIVDNLTLYKQHNGAVFQLGWSSEKSKNNRVTNIYVVEDETSWNQDGLEGNRAFLNTANGKESNSVSNLRIENVWYDSDISYILGIKSQGTYNGIYLKNMNIKGVQRFKSYLAGGLFSNVVLENVTLHGKKITNDAGINLKITGEKVDAVSYK